MVSFDGPLDALYLIVPVLSGQMYSAIAVGKRHHNAGFCFCGFDTQQAAVRLEKP